jgi:hypothetical protein
MAVPTRARRSPSSTPTVAPLSFLFSHRLNAISLSLSDFKQRSSAAIADLSFNLKLSPLSTSSSLSPLIFSKENFHGQNPYFGFRIPWSKPIFWVSDFVWCWPFGSDSGFSTRLKPVSVLKTRFSFKNPTRYLII